MVKLRPALKEDLEIVSSWIENKEACRLWGGDYMRFPHTVDELAKDICFDTEKTYSLVSDKGHLLGLGQLLKRNLRLHLARIIVAPANRGQGYGRLLCEKLIEEGVRRFKEQTFSLNVYQFNTPARRLYENLGFQAHTPPADSNAGSDSVYMVLNINDDR